MEETYIYGACKYCGQTYQTSGVTQEEADRLATQVCQCGAAQTEKRIQEIIRDAKERDETLFGAGGAMDGFPRVESPAVLRLLDDAIERVAYGELREVSMQIVGHGAAKIKSSGMGGVKIERTRTLKRSEETV